MRIWSLHPQYLDPKGLVALWRETLQAVPQYLAAVHAEAVRRRYRFDASKIAAHEAVPLMPVTTGQVAFE